MKSLFSAINRFETASSYWLAWHSMNLRVKRKDSMVSSMLDASEGYLKAEIIAEIELGILEYQQWRKDNEV